MRGDTTGMSSDWKLAASRTSHWQWQSLGQLGKEAYLSIWQQLMEAQAQVQQLAQNAVNQQPGRVAAAHARPSNCLQVGTVQSVHLLHRACALQILHMHSQSYLLHSNSSWMANKAQGQYFTRGNTV